MAEWLELFQRYLPEFIKGAGVTLELTVVGLTIGFVLGLALAVARVYAPKWLKALAIGYIELFRGTPLLVQLFLLYYGLPGIGITMSQGLAAFLALVQLTLMGGQSVSRAESGLDGGLVGWGLASAWSGRKYTRLAGSYFLAVFIHGLWNAFGLLMGLAEYLEPVNQLNVILGQLSGIAPAALFVLTVCLFGIIIYARKVNPPDLAALPEGDNSTENVIKQQRENE